MSIINSEAAAKSRGESLLRVTNKLRKVAMAIEVTKAKVKVKQMSMQELVACLNENDMTVAEALGD